MNTNTKPAVADTVPVLDALFGSKPELHARRVIRLREAGKFTGVTRWVEAVIMHDLPVAVIRIPDVKIDTEERDGEDGEKESYIKLTYRRTPIFLHNIEAVKAGDVVQGNARLVLKRVRTREKGEFVGKSAYYLHLDVHGSTVVTDPKAIPESAILMSVPKVPNVLKHQPVMDSFLIQVCASKVRAEELDLTALYSLEELGMEASTSAPARQIVRGECGGRERHIVRGQRGGGRHQNRPPQQTRSMIPDGWVPPNSETKAELEQPVQAQPAPPVVEPEPVVEETVEQPVQAQPAPKAPKAKKGGGKSRMEKVEGDGTFGALAGLKLTG